MTAAQPTKLARHDLAVDVIDASVDCMRCAAVCCRMPVLLMPDDRVAAWLTAHDDHGLECMRHGDDGWCVALDRDSMRCTIYTERPAICREFAMGGGDCREVRAAWQAEESGVSSTDDGSIER